jgi:hypothetical protein
MTIELTGKELRLLQTIFCFINEHSDWSYHENSKMHQSRSILMNSDEFDIDNINNIYEKLFE